MMHQEELGERADSTAALSGNIAAVAALPRTRLPERIEGFWSSVRFPAGMPDSLGAFATRSHRAQVWLLNWLTRPTSTGLFLSGQCSYQAVRIRRSEEHTSELQSPCNLV